MEVSTSVDLEAGNWGLSELLPCGNSQDSGLESTSFNNIVVGHGYQPHDLQVLRPTLPFA